MSYIFENIYLGNLYDADDDFLNDNKIKHIIRLTESDYIMTYAKTIKAYTFQISDLESEANRFYKLLPSIYYIMTNIPKDENILVHCNIGMSRSASVVIYYIMKTQNLKYDDALKFVKGRRPIVKPNVGFSKILKDNEDKTITK